jgi:hypothetical protein
MNMGSSIIGAMHCGKKKGEVRIIGRTLGGLGFLRKANYNFLFGTTKFFKRWNKLQLTISIQISSDCCLFQFFNQEKLLIAMSRNPDPRRGPGIICTSAIFFPQLDLLLENEMG